MELKLLYCSIPKKALDGFNRTFMELKRGIVTNVCVMAHCFNRTFMELKLNLRPEMLREKMF